MLMLGEITTMPEDLDQVPSPMAAHRVMDSYLSSLSFCVFLDMLPRIREVSNDGGASLCFVIDLWPPCEGFKDMYQDIWYPEAKGLAQKYQRYYNRDVKLTLVFHAPLGEP